MGCKPEHLLENSHRKQLTWETVQERNWATLTHTTGRAPSAPRQSMADFKGEMAKGVSLQRGTPGREVTEVKGFRKRSKDARLQHSPKAWRSVLTVNLTGLRIAGETRLWGCEHGHLFPERLTQAGKASRNVSGTVP